MDNELIKPVELISIYFPQLDENGFENDKEEMQLWERFVDLICMIRIFEKEQKLEGFDNRVGVRPEYDRLLGMVQPHEKSEFEGFGQLRHIFATLIMKENEAYEDGTYPVLNPFCTTGMLEPVEFMAFLLSYMVDRNRKYENLFAELQNEKVITKPTIGLVIDLCALFLTEDENSVALLLQEDTLLNRLILEKMPDEPHRSRLSKVVSLSRRILQTLNRENISLGQASSCMELLWPLAEHEIRLHYTKDIEELLNIYNKLSNENDGGVILLRGQKGIGKKFLLRSMMTVTGTGVIKIDICKLLSYPVEIMEDWMRMLVTKCIFDEMIVYLEVDGEVTFDEETKMIRFITFLQDYLPVIVMGGEDSLSPRIKPSGLILEMKLETPGRGLQKDFWKYFAQTEQVVFDDEINLDEIVSVFNLTPQKIHQVISSAITGAEIREGHYYVDKLLLQTYIRRNCSMAFNQYATRLESNFRKEDLQLNESARQMIEKVYNRVKYKRIVNEEFGFDKKLSYGRGIVVALFGPPGTGKTMAAQVIANELGMDIYRIDLSQIGSKYIGETEKKLSAVFEAAKYSNAILFFDEADALFAKRTSVSNSNDKHANAETAFLLQKMEEYSGISILATNVMNNFDDAFKRRITFMIPIETLDEEGRLELWEKIFPKEAPLAADVDFERYARVAVMNGSNIKSAAIHAAYAAAAKNSEITDHDLVQAIDEEYRRLGHTSIISELEMG